MSLAPELTARLERRPEARSFSIEDLLQEIQGGLLRIPRFQRGLKWGDQDRVNLFDSIYRGFPIGALLFWKRPAEAGKVGFGRFSIDAEARSDALWVVDGQQRITTLADVLLVGPSPDPTGKTIRFSLTDRSFVYGTESQKPPPQWIPLSEVHDSARLLAWAHEQRIEGRALNNVFDLGKRLREYQAPAYIVEADEAVMRQIFDRSNSSGKSLQAADVFDALHGAQSPEKPSSLRDIAAELEDLSFGKIEEKLVLRALLAVRRKDPGRDFRQIASDDIPAALAETASALRQAIAFVKNVAQFPHIELLPYKLPLATLALFFHEHREAGPRTKLLLGRWLWRGAISGAHLGNTVALRRTLDSIRPRDEGESVRNLLEEAGKRPSDPAPLRPFNFRHARTKLQLVALAALGPRHLVTGEKLDVAALCDQPQGPVIRLSSRNRLPGEDGLANRLLHPPLADSAFRRQLLVCDDADVLRSHLVSRAARQALQQRDFAGFLCEREADLGQHIETFLDFKAEWEASDRDRPSLSSLVVADATAWTT